MRQVCTTKEESQELLKLGIDKHSADMYYPVYPTGNTFPEICDSEEDGLQVDYPAWSLSALLQLVPTGTVFISKYKNPSVEFCNSQRECYIECKGISLFNCIFELVKRLLEDGTIK